MMANNKNKIVIALGSNVNQQSNIDLAIAMLSQALPGLVMTRKMWTDPIGMASDRFLNVLGMAYTELSIGQVEQMLKSIENQCGRCRRAGQSGVVQIDIDLLLYAGRRYHENDWGRPYVRELMAELDASVFAPIETL